MNRVKSRFSFLSCEIDWAVQLLCLFDCIFVWLMAEISSYDAEMVCLRVRHLKASNIGAMSYVIWIYFQCVHQFLSFERP